MLSKIDFKSTSDDDLIRKSKKMQRHYKISLTSAIVLSIASIVSIIDGNAKVYTFLFIPLLLLLIANRRQRKSILNELEQRKTA
ncbi:hypothetical protein M8998_05235 [Sphingobacterium sp. lm-10]|uniref:hypothetical protein n=1 Tax=Sphingobacterium sp. lm-10 TaxID=2944904 RepID=UPI0020204049|nr:hypothetical protein [Sphingobacterium sp. lm-10]MCL7987342.1 hypothetical protein [Sphingobacterium sp. lm-10]